ncbi:MAG: hypothetical protein WEB87_01185, partial [Bacteriovoracaceae bacterium]
MRKNEIVLLKAVKTALEMSQNCLSLFKEKEHAKALSVLEHRSRVIDVILHLNEQQLLTPKELVDEKFNNEFNQLITTLNQKDAEVEALLIEERLVTQNEIAKTRKNKE